MNPNDIESISVLKDAAACAIYGARAAYGDVYKRQMISLSLTFRPEIQLPLVCLMMMFIV